jgi:hypothetical protein
MDVSRKETTGKSKQHVGQGKKLLWYHANQHQFGGVKMKINPF